MLQSILSSKLYRSSTRKDKIRGAFEDPINAELVGQLADALDEEYQTPDYLVKDYDQSQESDTSNTSEGESSSTEPNDEGFDASPSPTHSSPNVDSSLADQVESEMDSSEGAESSSESNPSVDSSGDSSGSPSSDAGSDVVTEATKINKSAVVGSQMRSIFKNMRQVADQIKGMLNFKDSTFGVNRILNKENELWIYYNDDVNLNNVMGDVIEVLNASGYVYLEFNRLARSDNAIVFLIDFADTQNIIQNVDQINNQE